MLPILSSGWMEDAKTRSFPFGSVNAAETVGSLDGSYAVNSQTGSIGTASRWKSYFGRKFRKGDVVGTIIDLQAGTIRYLLRSWPSRNFPDVFGTVAFTIDVSKVYHAVVSLKYAMTQVEGRFTHPFALWDMVEAHYGTRDLFAALPPTPFRIVTPIYNAALPLPLPSVSTEQNMKALEGALERFEANTSHSLLLSLPFETILHIMSFIDSVDIPGTTAVCHAFYDALSHFRFWNEITERDFHFGFGISTQLYFDKLAQNSNPFGNVADMTLDDHHFRNPYSLVKMATASKLAKDRYRKRYHWCHGLYDNLTSLDTDYTVRSMAYDEMRRVLFFSEEETFFSYSFESGELSQGLMSTVGYITSMQCRFGLLFLATDHGFIHVLDAVSGAQIARFSDDGIRSLDAHYDAHSKTVLILTGTKHNAAKIWRLDGVHSRLKNHRPQKTYKTLSHLDHSTDSMEDTSGDEMGGNQGQMKGDEEEEFDSAHNNSNSPLIVPRLVWQSKGRSATPIVAVAFVPEAQGRVFVCASADGKIRAWRLKSSVRFDATRNRTSQDPKDHSSSEDDSKDSDTESHDDLENDPKMDDSSESTLPEFELDYGTKPFYEWTMVAASPLTALTCMSVSPEGWFVAAGASSGEMFVFDVRDGSPAASLPTSMFGGGGPGAGRVVGGVGARAVRLPHQSRSILHMHYECGGKLVTVQEDNSLRMWNQDTGLPLWKHQTPGVASSLFCTDDFLAYGLANGRVYILDFDEVELSEIRLEVSLNRRRDYLYRLSRHTPSK